jgi:hypothetical protein
MGKSRGREITNNQVFWLFLFSLFPDLLSPFEFYLFFLGSKKQRDTWNLVLTAVS